MDFTDYYYHFIFDGHDIPEERQDEALTESDWWPTESLLNSYANYGGANPNGFVVSASTTSTLDEISRALTRPEIVVLGVYGLSYMKKDPVVEKISRRVKRDNLFDVTVTASVMKKPDLKKIQAELGNMLGLQLRGEKTSKGRARLLCDQIKTVERILIILDDVWGEINLARIGIPFGNDHMGCKILLKSETQNVLFNQTNAQIGLSSATRSLIHPPIM